MSSTLISQNAIPIIDMAYIRTQEVLPIKSCTRHSAHKLWKALTDHGLALLVNHGITEMKLQQAYRRLEYFSGLSESDRKEFQTPLESIEESGYSSPCPKIAGGLIDYKHTFKIKANGKDRLPTCFSSNNFSSVDNLVHEFKSLASTILQFIAIGIGISPKYFRNVHGKLASEDDQSLLELVYYPPTDDCVPCDEKGSQEKTETGMFVLIAQDSESGLEVFQCKKWVSVGYLPGAILMMCGNLLKVWSEELCIPVPYRFTVPLESKARSRSRHCAILASRLPYSTIEFCPATSPKQYLVSNLEQILESLEDLPDSSSNQHLSSLQRAIHFIWKNCRFPCKCTS